MIKNNQDRLEKDLYTRQKEGAKVIHYSADSDVLEAKYVVEKIEQLISTVPDINYRDFAVLYRANYLSRTLEQELIRMQIPYRLFGGLKFFSRKEIKDALSYLRLTVFKMIWHLNGSSIRLVEASGRKRWIRSANRRVF